MVVTILFSIILSLFSTAIMSYISMAIPIGPWIAPTLVLIAIVFFRIYSRQVDQSKSIALATCAGSLGGILATGFGFSFPALYFLEKDVFVQWLDKPWYFFCIMSALAFAAGLFGLLLAALFAHKLIIEDQLVFPIGELIYKMIAAQQQMRKAWELIIGFCSTIIFCFLQDGLFCFRGIIAKAVTLLPATSIYGFVVPALRLDLWPLLWAIGFVTGHMIAIPLAIGSLIKIIIIDSINNYYFSSISPMDFILAFCSGMVIAGALQGFIGMPSSIYKFVKQSRNRKFNSVYYLHDKRLMVITGIVLLGITALLSFLRMPLLVQSYLLFGGAIVTYQLVVIAGKIGLAPLGRFATFIMVPALFLFKVNAIQIIFIATFVEVCAGVAADALFGHKIAKLSGIKTNSLLCYQLLGLVVSCASIGIIFWLLITNFTLGSDELFAQKALARATLINAQNFNIYVVMIGFIVGIILKYLHLNPALILSGILMPINLSIGLIMGALFTLLTGHATEWYPFWSGIFAANSLWMLIKTLL